MLMLEPVKEKRFAYPLARAVYVKQYGRLRALFGDDTSVSKFSRLTLSIAMEAFVLASHGYQAASNAAATKSETQDAVAREFDLCVDDIRHWVAESTEHERLRGSGCVIEMVAQHVKHMACVAAESVLTHERRTERGFERLRQAMAMAELNSDSDSKE